MTTRCWLLLLLAFARAANAPQLEKQLQKTVSDLVTTQGLPGATAAISIDGKVITVAAGYADREHHTRMKPDNRMLVGSATKPFFAFVVLSLAAEGKLDLDAPISRWIGAEPWFARLPNASTLTMRHLLSHRGGIINHIGDSSFARAFRSAGPDKWRKGFTPHEQIAFALDRPAPFPAGDGFLYTDTGYLIAALVVERVTQRTYYDELSRRVLKPLQLKSTTPSTTPALPGLPQGYRIIPPTLPPGGYDAWGLPDKMLFNQQLVINPIYEWTGGGLISTSADLARWMETLFERDPWKSFAATMITRNPADAPYGLGIFVRQTPDGLIYSHPGGFPGYRTEVAYSPELGVGVAYQANISGNIGSSLIPALLATVRANQGVRDRR